MQYEFHVPGTMGLPRVLLVVVGVVRMVGAVAVVGVVVMVGVLGVLRDKSVGNTLLKYSA